MKCINHKERKAITTYGFIPDNNKTLQTYDLCIECSLKWEDIRPKEKGIVISCILK